MEGRVSGLEQRVEALSKEMQESLQRMENNLTAFMERMEKERHDDLNHQNGNNSRSYTNSDERMRRLEVPYFTGEDPYDWLYRAERYFQVIRIPEQEKVMAAVICLEGRALN